MQYTKSEIDTVNKYNRFSKDPSFENFIFMNDGYVDLDEDDYPIPVNINLTDKYTDWKYQVNLYKKILEVAEIPVTFNGTLVDVSCGKGGGISFYKDYYNFSRLVGVDLNPTHIEICKAHTTGIEFLTGTATNLPLTDNSADVITTVEASGYYDPYEQYVEEAYRVLKPGGLLIQTTPHGFKSSIFEQQGFRIIKELDITKNVRIACTISKYRFFNKSKVIARALDVDEKRYWTNTCCYTITVFIK